jgi:hypothetical protein
MSSNGKTSALKEEFARVARRRRQDPESLLVQFMREYLEAWEDEKLHREMQRQARRSGVKESEAVEFVRRVRRDLRKRRGAS